MAMRGEDIGSIAFAFVAGFVEGGVHTQGPMARDEWQSLGWNVGIATGDIAENLHAPVLVETMETQRKRILSGNFPVFLILDECQMQADAQSGLNYEMAMGFLHPQRACCS